MLKELLEIFQLLMSYQQQMSMSGSRDTNFVSRLEIGATFQQILVIASEANLVIL